MSATNPSLEQLAHEIDRLSSYEAIRQLAYRYAISVDSRDIETIASLYAPGAPMGGTAVTRDEIIERFSSLLAQVPLSILNVGNHLIELGPDNDDAATGTVYCRAELEDGERWLVQQIVYRDVYRRTDGTWQFWSRQHLLFYGADLLQRPINLEPAGPGEHWDGKGSMPQVWDTYARFWERFPDATHY